MDKHFDDAGELLLPAIEFEQTVQAVFIPVMQQMAGYHKRTILAERSDIALRLYRGSGERQESIIPPSGESGTFMFDLQDFRCYLVEFESLMTRVTDADPSLLLDLAMKLFIGTGLGKHFATLDLGDRRIPSTRRRLQAIRDVFTNKDDIVDLFRSTTSDDQMGFMSRHIHDENVMSINAMRLGLRYMFDANPQITEPFSVDLLQLSATASMQMLIDIDGASYIKIARDNNRSAALGEKTFIYLVPDWLIAIALGPTKPESMRHLQSRAWLR